MAARAHLGVAELAHLAGLDLAAQLRGHGLHAVADAQDRHAELEHDLRRARRLLLGDRGVAAREDHAARIERAHELSVNVVGMQLAVHAGFAHPPRDELGDLGAEIEDEDLVQRNRTGSPLSQRDSSALPW